MALRHYTVIYDDQRPFEYQFHWHGLQQVVVYAASRFNMHWEEVVRIPVPVRLEPLGLAQRLVVVLDSVAAWLENH